MTKVNQTCGTCGGTGVIRNWIVEKEPVNREHGVAKLEEVKCSVCNGKGWLEYAMFTLEEAEQIMNVGLPTRLKNMSKISWFGKLLTWLKNIDWKCVK